ncbi:helix-turn-helix transcriptional regulator [Cytobacillus kochii]|uniref:helix-turn-helix transcriptional regulator n=1 Tax=Cytobacillus kochii TaxID=859143 RepID=UPI00402ADAD2
MNLSKQIKNYRTRVNFSQEDLAEKLYVSRQTISNWENAKSYPDIHNLLLMSVIFNVSLDDLVKGDLEMMKNEIQNLQLNKWTNSMILFMLSGVISIGPMMSWVGMQGLILSFALITVSLFSAHKVERIKKKHNLKTYKQILAFQEGRQLTDDKINYSRKKDMLIQVIFVLASALITGTFTWLSLAYFNV